MSVREKGEQSVPWRDGEGDRARHDTSRVFRSQEHDVSRAWYGQASPSPRPD